MTFTIKDLKEKIEDLAKDGFGDDTRIMLSEDMRSAAFELNGTSVNMVGTAKSTGKEQKLVFLLLCTPNELSTDDEDENEDE